MSKPLIALTPGEPAGIGPDITVQYAQNPSADFNVLVFADAALLKQRAEQLNLPLALTLIDAQQIRSKTNDNNIEIKIQQANQAGHLAVIQHALAAPCIAGTTDIQNANYVLDTLRSATQACLHDSCNALVTGPVHKGLLNQAGFEFSGHTEFLADLASQHTGEKQHPVMMLSTEGLNIALATTHLPLKDVPTAITCDLLRDTLQVIETAFLNYFTAATPCIYVCGLNPHAGDDGSLGQEEIDIIQPVLEEFRQKGFLIRGPLSADTIFSPHNMKEADIFLAMYHDQGLPVLKYKGFSNAINVSLGLSFIRTSVDHGTALELAGSGNANAQSLQLALQTANKMITKKNMSPPS